MWNGWNATYWQKYSDLTSNTRLHLHQNGPTTVHPSSMGLYLSLHYLAIAAVAQLLSVQYVVMLKQPLPKGGAIVLNYMWSFQNICAYNCVTTPTQSGLSGLKTLDCKLWFATSSPWPIYFQCSTLHWSRNWVPEISTSPVLARGRLGGTVGAVEEHPKGAEADRSVQELGETSQ